jgi:hypothetical protein
MCFDVIIAYLQFQNEQGGVAVLYGSDFSLPEHP